MLLKLNSMIQQNCEVRMKHMVNFFVGMRRFCYLDYVFCNLEPVLWLENLYGEGHTFLQVTHPW